MDLPNKITFIRICFVPIILFLLLCRSIPNRYFWSLMIFVVASYTDYLDGQLARRNGLVTNFGKFLDPLADKVLITSILVCFVEMGLVCAVPVVLVIFREFMVTFLRLISVERGKVISANYYGKIKTVSQMISVFLIMFSQGLKELFIRYNFEGYSYVDLSVKISSIVFWVSAILTLFSGILYVYNNKDCIR